MEKLRKPFQGVLNIIRFNWHFYVISLLVAIGFLLLFLLCPANNYVALCWGFIGVISALVVSLAVSFYVYDVSDFYSFNWLPSSDKPLKIVNIHAGFDETSQLLKLKYPYSELVVLDFYNPLLHTELSIKRARKAYPLYPGTLKTNTADLNLPHNSVDTFFIIFAAHEIRNDVERIIFFQEINRALKPEGRVIVTEHLRDAVNFAAYNIGFFHFLPKRTWLKTFLKAGLIVQKKQNITPFVTTFTLVKHGVSS